MNEKYYVFVKAIYKLNKKAADYPLIKDHRRNETYDDVYAFDIDRDPEDAAAVIIEDMIGVITSGQGRDVLQRCRFKAEIFSKEQMEAYREQERARVAALIAEERSKTYAEKF